MHRATTKTTPKGGIDAAYVHQCAWMAFFTAAGAAAAPSRLSYVAERFGYDPIHSTQEEMVRRISERFGSDLHGVHREHASPLGGHALGRISRGVARKTASAAHRVQSLSKVSGRYGMAVRIAAGLLVGGYAYYSTRKLGLACLAAADSKTRGD